MALWLAICITLLASTGNSIGKALQKHGTKGLPKFSFESKVVWSYVHCTEWLVGIVADLLGGVLMLGAYALAPVSIVQPVSGMGLVSLAVFSHFYLKERLASWEWAAVALAGAGTLGLGTDESTSNEHGMQLWRVVLVFVLMGMGMAGAAMLHAKHIDGNTGGGGGTPGTDVQALKRTAAMSCGLQAGVCFGLSAAACKVGMLLATTTWLWFPVGMAMSVLLTSGGLVLQNRGFKDGNTVLVCTCAAVTAMVSGVAVGVVGLGESMPATARGKVVRLLSWSLILSGVSMIAHGPEGMQVAAAMLASLFPRGVLNKLPTPMAVKLRQTAQRLELPTHHNAQ